MQKIVLNILQKLGTTAVVPSGDGEQVFNLIMKALKSKVSVILNFNNVELITPTFLNAAIGQLYNYYESSFLKEHLRVENMEKDDLLLLKKGLIGLKSISRIKKL